MISKKKARRGQGDRANSGTATRLQNYHTTDYFPLSSNLSRDIDAAAVLIERAQVWGAFWFALAWEARHVKAQLEALALGLEQTA